MGHTTGSQGLVPAPRPLSDLGLHARGDWDVQISGLSVDSRDVKPGHLFAALPGVKVHGAEFIQYALRMGAAAVLTDPEGAEIAASDLASYPEVAVVVVEEPRAALSYSAALWFGAQPDVMVAATGTNGKTSVATFTRQIWEELDLAAVNFGTTGVEGAFSAPLNHTTPEPITLHRLLAKLKSEGITHAAMEASSHGLAQSRLDGVRLMAAAFTNFSQDHLDYHTDFDDYFNAKAGLFDRVLSDDGTAVINIDDSRGSDMLGIAHSRGHQVLTIGRRADADLRIMGQRYDATGQDLLFEFMDNSHHTRLKLIGGFQAENILAAAGLVIGTGVPPEEVFETLPRLGTVRGRMELAATRDNGAPVFVDYSHTPDAIASALKALRPHVMGRIVAIVGAGGDRDTTKRPLMGQAACENADVVFVTDDNPRSEDPAVIRSAVMLGCAKVTGITALEVGDRAEAILRGVDALGPGDALLICGKGHETGQVVGDQVLPFDDCEQASVAVAALEGRLT
ncbi:UDP-N-acetylmuramoyl-L-alanyl-D-glutamate--2,6-diaminopimelate ligase [Halocynthiibacter namhaensis]|uniref:UDP-N-acetylmuramoyl-L-alanyl-D-glutamate--2, 6-diaminopimelate ligase n=1 Tax=Halocynthiibacter namhaensis TaxID=1290553 RepID=UPI00068E241B|nr:UDP-N-acetylmuramoyl-L-alanyl-D-glutamate--2,6-diaminopimelate ligase [Halocynthiibacter namhaensis]